LDSVRHAFRTLEQQRLALQIELDGLKTPAERNKLGQYSTPALLAQDILRYAERLLPKEEKIRFLDPALGTGAFYSALRCSEAGDRITRAAGFEIDPEYGRRAAMLWGRTGLEVFLGDFTRQKPEPGFNVLICNPPYVRHHHLTGEEKARLQLLTTEAYGTKISGLAGLYCHFVGLSHGWMADGAIAGWLIPSEFMDVNYGQALKCYLLNRTTLLHIHRFDPNEVQFADALVSSAVIWFRKSIPPRDHSVIFSSGGNLCAPKMSRSIPADALAKEGKWTRFPGSRMRRRPTLPTLADFFKIKRGIATGNNGYFILSGHEIAARCLPWPAFRPILPSPRYLTADVIQADWRGHPRLEQRLFLLDLRLNEREIQRRYPTLWSYLEEGKTQGVHQRYLCRHRALWYAQENRPPAPIVCTYFGRQDTKSGRTFRFILNRSEATVANVYLAMYPVRQLAQAMLCDRELIYRVWTSLNRITSERLLGEGRVYGGGLYKLEPRELANVPVPALADLLPLIQGEDTRAPVTDLVH
jgi:adenine-specific DNA-methyltransferase